MRSSGEDLSILGDLHFDAGDDRADGADAPGIGTVHDLKAAYDAGARIVRVVTHCTEADISRQHIEVARQLGMEFDELCWRILEQTMPAEQEGAAR